MNMNPMLMIDGYKLDHRRQYPVGTQRVYSNWTPRSCRIEGETHSTMFGLQYFLKRFMTDLMQEHFFNKPRHVIEKEYKSRVDGYVGPNQIGTSHIAALHELGYVPLRFSAIPEGTRTPLRCPQVISENTIDEFFWLPNYFETLMSCNLWKGSTSANMAYRFRKMLNKWAEVTGGNKDFVQWQGHDFSFRGMSGVEDAMLSGAGHLLSFTGTDTIPAILFAEEYYPGDNGLIGGSVPATEHSVMCANGEDGEMRTFDHLLDLYPSGIVSIVSDTWNLWRVLTQILPARKDRIMARQGKVVIRPDSGDPVLILCGDNNASEEIVKKGVIRGLHDVFGGSKNGKGFIELDPHIGAIYGDAITVDRGDEISRRLFSAGFASTNSVYGIGSYTYQYTTRDVYGLAMKATWAQVNGVGRDLFKKPITDNGMKNSAKGRLAVVKQDGKFFCINQATPDIEAQSVLRPVWCDGKFIQTQSFKNVRETLWGSEDKV